MCSLALGIVRAPRPQMAIPNLPVQAPSLDGHSTRSLLRDAVAHTKELVRLELGLARQELGEELLQVRRAAILAGVAVALGLVFLSTLAFALVLAWGGTAVVALGVAAGVLAIAGGMGALAYRAIPKRPLARSRERLQKDLTHLKEHAAVAPGHGVASPSAAAQGPEHERSLAVAADARGQRSPWRSSPAATRADDHAAHGLKGRLASAASMLKQTAAQWSKDEAARLAASLALYTMLSIAPLLVIAISIAGMAFGVEAARGQISQQISSVVGAEAGKAIEALVANAQNPSSGILSSIIGTAVLLFGASGVFGELQSALNRIWEVKPKPGRGIIGVLRDRFLSFSMVMGVAFLLLVSLVVSAALAAMTSYFQSLIPLPVLWQAVDVVVGLGLATVIFALTFKVVPDVKIRWRDVWVGGVATAVAFSIGRVALAWYVGRSSTVSPFGAAGSLVALVVWIYYSAQILFLGAEFAQVYAARHGSRILPSENAVPIEPIDQPGQPRGATAST